jgi:hypothetical protein
MDANEVKVKVNHSKNFTVNGDIGDTLFVKHKWRNEDKKRINLSAKLSIPPKAFKGDLTFDMIFDLENYALELYPSPYEFDNPVTLDLTFKNVDFSEIDMDNTDFTYLDGEEKMEYKSVKFDPQKGVLEVKGAVIKHFSRYGWTRNKNNKKKK